MFRLYSVAAFNANNGDVVLEPTVVSAKSEDSARNKAVSLLCDLEIVIDGEEVELDKALDTLTIVVRPF